MLEGAGGLPVTLATGKAVEAPGMMASHYAPDAVLQTNVARCPRGAALLAFGDDMNRERGGASAMLNLSPAGDLREAAANLYAMLKLLDAGHPKLIAVEPVPMEGLGIAINDRLARAAAPREAV